jgi:hypothetical protein
MTHSNTPYRNAADAVFIAKACTLHDELVAALRSIVCAADDLTDGQIDPSAGQSERDFIAAHEAARTALAKLMP